MTNPNPPKIKIAGKLPPAEKNGLTPDVAQELMDDPSRVRVIIAVLTATGEDRVYADMSTTVKTEMVRIEVVTGDDLKTAQKLILRAADQRSGKAVLPLETELDIESIFAAFVSDDPGTFPDGDDESDTD